jgi:hypothetical protein
VEREAKPPTMAGRVLLKTRKEEHESRRSKRENGM